MNRMCIVMVILALLSGGNGCGRSTKKPEAQKKVMEEQKNPEEKAFEEEPKAPPGAIKQEGSIEGHEYDTPPE